MSKEVKCYALSIEIVEAYAKGEEGAKKIAETGCAGVNLSYINCAIVVYRTKAEKEAALVALKKYFHTVKDIPVAAYVEEKYLNIGVMN